jgi:hypothetical protein
LQQIIISEFGASWWDEEMFWSQDPDLRLGPRGGKVGEMVFRWMKRSKNLDDMLSSPKNFFPRLLKHIESLTDDKK